MINFFLISIVVTFIVVRFWAYFIYKSNNYFDELENPRTLVGWLRIKTGFDWRHVHFGVLIFFADSLLIYANGFTALNSILLGIGASMTLDQIFPLIGNWDYFSRKMLIMSVLLHLIAILVWIKIFY